MGVKPGSAVSAARRAGSFVLVLAVLSSANIAYGQSAFAGNVRLVDGVTADEYVKIIRPGHSGILQAKPGDALFVGDTLKTGAGVKAKIELSDGTSIIAVPDATLQLSAQNVDKTSARRDIALKVLKGSVRLLVGKTFKVNPGAADMAWRESQVSVETYNSIAVVKGTDVIITVAGGDSLIAVLEGAVAVRSTRAGGETMVFTNQVVTVGKDGQRSGAVRLPAERRDQLASATTIDTGSTGLTPGQLKAKPSQRYSESDVARDVVSGVALSTVLDRAVDSGMNIEDAVGAAINAGLNPSAVVYTAIQEGYPAARVVETALIFGVPSTQVFSAALSAGADRQMVIRGAQAAGMPAPAIAGSMASATTGDVQMITSAPPSTAAAPSSVLPPLVTPIGVGGAPPSTQPASPYK